MPDQEERQSHFPQELDYLEQELTLVEQQLAEIDNQIDNLPPNNSPRLAFSPPGMSLNRNGGDQKGKLEQQKAELIGGFKGYSQNELSKTDPKTATKLNDFIDYRLSDNEFKNKSRDELKGLKADGKMQERSFDFSTANHFNKYQPQITPGAPSNSNLKVDNKSPLDRSQLWLDKINTHKQSTEQLELAEKAEIENGEISPKPDAIQQLEIDNDPDKD